MILPPKSMFYLPAGWFYMIDYSPGTHMWITFNWKPHEWEDTVSNEKEAIQDIQDILSNYKFNKKNKDLKNKKDKKNNNVKDDL
jgi:hypothetical protein